MRHLEEILVPIEFSPACAEVARYAAAVARRFHSTITLMHTVPPLDPTLAFMGSGELVQETLARQEEEILNDLDLFAADVLKGISVRRAVYEGDPGEMIASHCAAERVGLVMMPTAGCDALRRFVFGSV